MPNVAFHMQHTEHYKWKPYTANITVHAMHTPPTSRHTPHARCKLDIPHAYIRTLHTPLDCKLYTSHCKLHTSHWARNAQRCISHPAYWTLQMKTIHCKHYSPRHAHSTHQSPHSARQMQTRHSTCLHPHSTHSIRLQTLHFTLQTPHLTLGTKRPTLHFTSSILNTTNENHTLQTLQSTPCTLHAPVATPRTPDANSTFHMPTSALYTLQNHTHTEKKCKMAQGSKQVWGSRPRLKRNMPRLRKSRSRSEKSDPRSKKGIQGQKKR